MEEETAGPDLKALIGNNFTEQVGASGSGVDDKAHEKRMEAFIDERMGVAVEEEVRAPKVMSEEDKLYVIADAPKTEDAETAEGITGYDEPGGMPRASCFERAESYSCVVPWRPPPQQRGAFVHEHRACRGEFTHGLSTQKH